MEKLKREEKEKGIDPFSYRHPGAVGKVLVRRQPFKERKKEKFVNKPVNLGNIVIFRPKGEKGGIEVQLKEETVWLTQAQMAELFLTDRSVITKHIGNILKSKELRENSVCAFFAHTAEGTR